MTLRALCSLLAVAVLGASAADARVHRVHPGDSIQSAINAAKSGDTILVWPGTYEEKKNTTYGLRITQDNIRLIGKVVPGLGDKGKVRLVATGTQETGIYAAPAGSEPATHMAVSSEP